MASINENNTSTPANSKRKAAAFINNNIVSKDGTKTKQLGGIPLYWDNPFHAKILEHLKGGGDVTIETGVHIVEETDASDFF